MLTGTANEKSWKSAFPDPPPPPEAAPPNWLTPQLNERTSISSLCFWSTDSPGISAIFRNMSTAIAQASQAIEVQVELGRAVAAQLAGRLPRRVGARGTGVPAGATHDRVGAPAERASSEPEDRSLGQARMCADGTSRAPAAPRRGTGRALVRGHRRSGRSARPGRLASGSFPCLRTGATQPPVAAAESQLLGPLPRQRHGRGRRGRVACGRPAGRADAERGAREERCSLEQGAPRRVGRHLAHLAHLP